MSYAPIEYNIEEAVEQVKKMYRLNHYDFRYCVRFVASQWRLDFSLLLSKCNTRGPIKTPGKKFKSPKVAYGGRTPYWLNDK